MICMYVRERKHSVDGSWLNNGSTHNFATLQECENNTYSVETVLQILTFDLFLG